jgi:streptogramin lyase
MNDLYFYKFLTFCSFLFLFSANINPIYSQNEDWHFIRPDNTGIGGGFNEVISQDCFGNIWTIGYNPYRNEGSVVRFDGTTFTNWGTYDGYISSPRGRSMVFDNLGRLWCGLDHGIAMFDGTDWINYTPANVPALINRDYGKDIAVDSNNNIWVVLGEFGGLRGGIAKFDGVTWQTFTTSNSNLQTEDLNSIALDDDDIVWIGSSLGLIKYDGIVWDLWDKDNSGLNTNGGLSSEVYEINIHDDNRVFALTAKTLNIFDGTNWEYINSTNSPLNQLGLHQQFDISGDKIVISERNNANNLYIYDGVSWTQTNSRGPALDVLINDEGVVWTCGQNNISRFDNNNWTYYTNHNTGVSEYFTNDIFIDSQNRKWIANANGGEHVFDCPNWEIYGPWNENLFPIPQSLSTSGTHTVEDSEGDIWFSYDGIFGYAVRIPGGNYSDYGSWITYDIDDFDPDYAFQFISEISADDSGHVFIRNGNNHVVWMFDHSNDSWTPFWPYNGASLAPGPIYSMSPQANGIMWFGQYNYLSKFQNGNWTYIDYSTLMPNVNHIFDIEFDSQQNMWIATDNGLWKNDGTTYTQFTEANSGIAANAVTSIEIDQSDNIYIGAHQTATAPYYGGISIYDGINWTTFLEDSSPLAHKQVEDIELDQLGNLWIDTESEGITIYRAGGVLGFECIDLTMELCSTLSIEDDLPNALNEMSVYPNPLRDEGEIKITGFQGEKVTIEIYNIIGGYIMTLYEGNMLSVQDKFTFNLGQFPDGVYLLIATFPRSTLTKKIIKF